MDGRDASLEMVHQLRAAVDALATKAQFPQFVAALATIGMNGTVTAPTEGRDDGAFLRWTSLERGQRLTTPESELVALGRDYRVCADREFVATLSVRRIKLRLALLQRLVHAAIAAYHAGTLADDPELFSRIGNCVMSPRAKAWATDKARCFQVATFAGYLGARVDASRSPILKQIHELIGIYTIKNAYTSAIVREKMLRDDRLALWLWDQNLPALINQLAEELTDSDLLIVISASCQRGNAPPTTTGLAVLRALLFDRLKLPDPRDPDTSFPEEQFGAAGYLNLVSWLIYEDVGTFFDKLLSEDQGRRQFWGRYAPAVRRMRILLSDSGRQQLSTDFLRRIAPVRGNLSGGNVKASALILDFGSTLVVEFSEKNHSCFVFDTATNQALIDSWMRAPTVRVDMLKGSGAADRWAHHLGIWRTRFELQLAKRNVRPGGKR